ncbi:extracellular matrix protein 2-like isoform X2 [Lycorma delicatula]
MIFNNTEEIPNQNFLLRDSETDAKYRQENESYSIYTNCFPHSNVGKGKTSLKPITELHVDCRVQQSKSISWINNEKDKHAPTLEVTCLNDTNIIFTRLSQFSQNIKTIDLSMNCIKTIHTIPYLPNVTLLKYKYNAIEFIEERAFANLGKLQILDLSHNLLTGMNLRAGVFRGNYSSSLYEPLPINILNLGYNNIQSIEYRTFEHLPYLRELHLDGNPLEVIDYSTATAINSIKYLEVLNLAKTELSTVPYNMFDKLKIKALYINGNYFHAVPPELALLGKSLEFLDLNENPIKKFNSDSFLGLSNLKEIVAAGMKELTTVNEGTFLHLHSLEKLTLSYNPNLINIDPFAFSFGTSGSSSSIKIVRLDNNNLHHISEHLLPWSQLEVLDLSGNPWHCDCGLKWILDLKEKQNLSVIQKCGMKCKIFNWPDSIGTDVYNKPIRKFICAHNTDYFSRLQEASFLYTVITLITMVIIFVTIGSITIMNVIKCNRSHHIMIHDVTTHSNSIKENFNYNKLRNDSIHEV